MSNPTHVFVLCAYGKSPYLEECIRSLQAQTVSSPILLCTSTPSDFLDDMAKRYALPLFINEGEAGITGDWNFAISQADADFVTIAHQDDVYDPTYTELILQKANKTKKPLLLFTDYFEIRNGERVYKNGLLKIKKMLSLGFSLFPRNRFMRLRTLALGNAICCPAVTYPRDVYKDFRFDKAFRFACDWDAWDRIARNKGSFVRIKQPLVGHRIHEESETTKQTAGTGRAEEEYTMFRRYWPKWIARKLSKFYGKGADSNQLDS